MKLSICIPVYNFDVRSLVADLRKEIADTGLDAEILLIDDASNDYFKEINGTVAPEVENFVFLEKNVGRSQIRNLFLYYTKGDYLLFLDCDGKIIEKNFLNNYMSIIVKNPEWSAIYGGRQVADEKPDITHILRWKFATYRENLPLPKRLEQPYLSFQTNNFVVKKSLLQKINFNPEFQKYGYEDLLFSMDLQAAGIRVDHCENPIFNNDLESNDVYLKKVEESIESLYKMMSNRNTASKIEEIKVLKALRYMEKSGMSKWFLRLFEQRKEAARRKLLETECNLRYLDFYKLGLLMEKFHKK